ncbi:MAG: arylesterase, partial [Burkholderiales bacterium]
MLTRILLIFCLGLPSLAQSATTILVFGNSLSSGYGIPLQRGWVHLLQSRLDQSHPGHRVVNASLSGETSHGGAYRIDKALTTHKPDIIIVELGGNDGLRGLSLADTERNLAKIIDIAQRRRAKVLLVGLRLPPNYGAAYTRQFEDMYRRLARRFGVERVPFMLEGLGNAQFLSDRIHPNAAAQSLILGNV